MPCGKAYKKVMGRVRKEYPSYGLKRRKKITNAVLYRKRK